MDAFYVGLGAVVPKLHARGPIQPDAHGRRNPPKGAHQLLHLISGPARVENSPAVQRDLTVMDTEMWKLS